MCGGVWLQTRECVCLVLRGVCVAVCGYKYVSVCMFFKVCMVVCGYKHVSVCVFGF